MRPTGALVNEKAPGSRAGSQGLSPSYQQTFKPPPRADGPCREVKAGWPARGRGDGDGVPAVPGQAEPGGGGRKRGLGRRLQKGVDLPPALRGGWG